MCNSRRNSTATGSTFLVALAVTFALVAAAHALTVPGGGPRKTAKNDCLVTLDVDGITAATATNAVACTDGNPDCDFDYACNGSCEFQVRVCTETPGLTPACTPATALKSLKETGKRNKRVNFTLPPLTGSACGAFAAVKVDTVTRRGVVKAGVRKVSLVAVSDSRPKRRDADATKFTCNPKPAADPCPAQPLGRLSFTFTTGSTSCGGPAFGNPPHCGGTQAGGPTEAPFSGGLFDGPNGTGTKVADLGLGCLYFGGGCGELVPPGPIPNGAKTIFEVRGNPDDLSTATLAGSAGTGRADCTLGPLQTRHCQNDLTLACTSNGQCPQAGSANQCQLDAQCNFGPPLPLRNGPISTCVVNLLAESAAGTVDLTTGNVNVTSYLLRSNVYVTGNDEEPCPLCTAGMCSYGKRAGLACTPTGTFGTTLDCPPDDSTFLGPLSVNLAPLSTGATVKTAADGLFCTDKFCLNGRGACTTDAECETGECSGQRDAGAFGIASVRSITETGSPAGDLRDNASHAGVLGYVFCIPAPGEPATSSANLPGPGAVSINGTFQFQPE